MLTSPAFPKMLERLIKVPANVLPPKKSAVSKFEPFAKSSEEGADGGELLSLEKSIGEPIGRNTRESESLRIRGRYVNSDE